MRLLCRKYFDRQHVTSLSSTAGEPRTAKLKSLSENANMGIAALHVLVQEEKTRIKPIGNEAKQKKQ